MVDHVGGTLVNLMVHHCLPHHQRISIPHPSAAGSLQQNDVIENFFLY
jgi:hypothetical protein